MARVSGRVKGRESLYKKLIKWSEDESKSKLFTNKHDVFSCVGDLAAVRVMTYVEQDRHRVASIAQEIFTHRPNKEDFEYEIKENSSRIKNNDANYYRASHMQICLRQSDLVGNQDNLKEDHCELQITSMLAHVWNEIEHDIVYKGDHSILSSDEKSAIESLGLLTKTGDNIISSLISSNLKRETDRKLKTTKESEEIRTQDELSDFLNSHYGDKFFSRSKTINYRKNTEALLNALVRLGFTHPSEIIRAITPKDIYNMRKEHWPRFKAFLTSKDFKKPFPDMDTCDLFLLTLISLHSGDIAAQTHTGMGPKPRQIAFANRWEEFMGPQA